MTDHRRHTLQLAALFLLGTALRLGLASGYGLGDDPGYFDSYATMARGPIFDPGAQYSNRFAIAVPVAFSLWWSGYSEVGFIAPVTIASLLNLVLVYLIARDAWGRDAGRLALALLAVFPLEVLCATLFAPDVILATYAFGAYWLLGRALAAPPATKRGPLLASGAGIAVVLGFLSKPWILLTLPALAWESRRHLRTHPRTLATATVAAALPIAGYLGWQAIELGDSLHHIHVTQGVAVFAPYSWRTFTEYPAMLLRSTEYGTLLAGVYPHLLLALAVVEWRRSAVLGRWLLYTAFLITGISAMPAHHAAAGWETLVPRIFRYLTFASIPLCLALTAYLRAVTARWPRIGTLIAGLLLAGSLPAGWALTAPSRDVFGEWRRIHALLTAYPDDIVYFQSDLARRYGSVVLKDRGRERAVPLLAETPTARATEFATIRDGLVVTGGAGLPWYGCGRCVADVGDLSVPSSWRLLMTFAGTPTRYRREPLRLWRVGTHDAEAATLLEAAPDRPAALALTDAVLNQPNSAALAITLLERLWPTAPTAEVPALLQRLGRACLAANRPICAIQALEQARNTTTDPGTQRTATADLIRAYAHPRLGDFAVARQLRDELAQRFPDTPTDVGLTQAMSVVAEAQSLYHREQLTRAAAILRTALADPDFPAADRPTASYFRALIAFRRRAIDAGIAARDAYRGQRGRDPQWVELLFREAQARQWGQRPLAITLLQQIIAAGQGTGWPAVAKTLLATLEHPRTTATDQ